jgi:hypothetical protein
MDEELKRYLDEQTATLMAAIELTESRIISALQSRGTSLDPLARKLEGKDAPTEPDTSRIQAGH